jgi:hypothetical protein
MMRLFIGIVCLFSCLIQANQTSIKWVLSETPFAELSPTGKAIAALELIAFMHDELHQLLSKTKTTIAKDELEEIINGLKTFEEHLIAHVAIPIQLKSHDLQKDKLYPHQLFKKLKIDHANIRYQHAHLRKVLDTGGIEERAPTAFTITVTSPAESSSEKTSAEPVSINPNFLHAHYKKN